MIVAGSTNPLLLSSAGGYNLTNSLRFRSSASAYLNKTFGSSGNRKTYTISFWIKRGKLATQQFIFTGFDGTISANIQFNSSDQLVLNVDGNNNYQITTTQVFRDPAAWYHLVFAVDTTQATAANRLKMYVNGVQVTALASSSYPTQNNDTYFFGAFAHWIGASQIPSLFTDGYFAEFNAVDGQALTPSSFGETSTTTGVWIPKKFSGTYGTNGFYLPFTDTTSTSTLGTDFSGNSNTWTVNGISLTAGSTYDSMTDVPTLTSATTANYCVLNPLDSTLTLINANLSWNAPSNTELGSRGTIGVSSGKWYYEYKITSTTANPFSLIGWASQSQNNNSTMPTGVGSSTWAYYPNDFKTYNSGTASSVYGVTGSANDIIMVALDLDNSRIYWGRNGTWFSSGNPATQTNPAYTNVSGTLFPWIQEYNQTSSANFGQQPFSYTPPTGFLRLNTFNLPTPTIGATAATTANKYMDVLTWTGNGASSRAITGLNFQPDWVWDKMRSDSYQHAIVDSVRGGNQVLHSNSTSAEDTNWQYGYVSSFDSNGFTIQAGSTSSENWNLNAATFVAWNWKANGAGSSNTQGSITSTVSASTTAGFSIVTYTGNGTNGSTVGHGLGVSPNMVIVKSRTSTNDWAVYHSSLTAGNMVFLNTSGQSQAITTYDNGGINPVSSTTFTIAQGGITQNNVNGSGTTYVAYCFAQVAGYSAFGSYTGNASTDGTFIYLGFRPRFIMIKRTTSADPWIIHDTARDIYNGYSVQLYPNDASAEGGPYSPPILDELSNGFKLRSSGSAANGSGDTFIYMAFAESPFKYANAR